MKKKLFIFSLMFAHIELFSEDLLLALNDLPHERIKQLCNGQPGKQQASVVKQSLSTEGNAKKSVREINKDKIAALKLKHAQKQSTHYSKFAHAKDQRKQEFKVRENERLAKSQEICAQADQLREINQKKRDQWLEASRKAAEIQRLAKLELLERNKTTPQKAAAHKNSRLGRRMVMKKDHSQLASSSVLPLPKIVQEKLKVSTVEKPAPTEKQQLAKSVHHYLTSQKDDEWIVPASLPTLRMGIPLDSKPQAKKMKQ